MKKRSRMRIWNRIHRLFPALFLFLLLIGCANPEGKSQELYDTAQFEEQQQNFKHARELYQRIVNQYPETAAASKAKERLDAIRDK